MLNISLPLALLGLPGAHWLFIIPIALLSIFLMLLILVQRGRGGGLTGALGGMGGQSAFGTKAGDVFTKITIVTAMLWILLSMGALRLLHVEKFGSASSSSGSPATRTGGDTTSEDNNSGDTTPLTPEDPGTVPPSSTPSSPPSTPAEDDKNK
jgi:preprotein translocase subunit SecG